MSDKVGMNNGHSSTSNDKQSKSIIDEGKPIIDKGKGIAFDEANDGVVTYADFLMDDDDDDDNYSGYDDVETFGNISDVDVETFGNVSDVDVETVGNVSDVDDKTFGNVSDVDVDVEAIGNITDRDDEFFGNVYEVNDEGHVPAFDNEQRAPGSKQEVSLIRCLDDRNFSKTMKRMAPEEKGSNLKKELLDRKSKYKNDLQPKVHPSTTSKP